MRRTVARRRATALAGVVCTLAFATALSVPAGALGAGSGTGFGPHASAKTAPASERAHDIAPLTLANFVVTDLATNQSSVFSYTNVTPVNAPQSFCNVSTTSNLCVTYGTGSGSGGGTIDLSPQDSAGWQAGAVYDPIAGPSGISVAGATCLGVQPPTVGSALEVDQYTFSSGAVQNLALQFDCTTSTTDITGTVAYNIVPTDPEDGYYVFGQAGEITGFGNDNYLSYLNGAQYYDLNAPIVGMAPTADGAGYWMVGGDGGVFASGDAGFYGSTGNLHLNKPVVGMAATPDGKGYWFVASDGGIFAYGDAGFYGSRGGQPLNKPIVGMAATPDGKGYWLVASDGGIFAYGDAGFFGSRGGQPLNKPIVGMTATPDGQGYWFVASDGGIFSYGDASFYGSTGSIKLNEPIVGMAGAPDGKGYWFVASDGGVFNYGSADFEGSLGGTGVTDAAGISTGILGNPPI